jgi:hypothetical protein
MGLNGSKAGGSLDAVLPPASDTSHKNRTPRAASRPGQTTRTRRSGLYHLTLSTLLLVQLMADVFPMFLLGRRTGHSVPGTAESSSPCLLEGPLEKPSSILRAG